MNYVAYYRVSTERQGKSGLGLAAQKRKIEDFLSTAGTLIGEFCDIQSGRDDSRFELQKALALAKLHGAKIIIARLDRFSRRVSFIANILEQGIGLCCAEMPNARLPTAYLCCPGPGRASADFGTDSICSG